MKKIRVQFNKGGLYKLVLLSACKQGKKKENKKTDLSRARCSFPVLCQVLLLPAQQENTAAASATAFMNTQRGFYVISSIQILACNKTGTWTPGWKTNHPQKFCMHRAEAGTGALVGLRRM